ncbi:MAG: YbaK/EbsC family protein [Selenomonadaceae bacterium]|nr:YbaK/EbsC family protein [Selenomonadaceae bacterium]
MAIEKVKKYFAEIGEPERVVEFEELTATSEQAAHALNCEVGRIAKTISVFVNKKPVLILLGGDMNLDNKKFKAQFGCRPHMIPVAEVENLIGHAVGGVCPFAVNDGVPIYLDESLKRFEFVYPAAGNDKSVVKLTLDELEKYIKSAGWVDVAKLKGGA